MWLSVQFVPQQYLRQKPVFLVSLQIQYEFPSRKRVFRNQLTIGEGIVKDKEILMRPDKSALKRVTPKSAGLSEEEIAAMKETLKERKAEARWNKDKAEG